ncbi:hypothetical protein [Nocardia aurantia]|uniref:Uncharacterized protein n=1 Tax=Nocardia aurantia TaxID=2585199 RepID=A0A7K0DMZ3_9NOCA|nr:hypothetical protein [Nocardia aurantia]MQY27115.1 hypothetical protein [Nocardia aurantia]
MTALLPAGGRKVVRPNPSRERGGRTLARHAAAPGRPAVPLRTGRHAAPSGARRTRPAHAALDRYDRMMLGLAGWLLAVRVALVGERQFDER